MGAVAVVARWRQAALTSFMVVKGSSWPSGARTRVAIPFCSSVGTRAVAALSCRRGTIRRKW